MRTGNYAVVVAAGRGVRMGAAVNKVLLPLCGEPVIRHAVCAFRFVCEIDGVVVVASADETEQMRAALCGLEKVCAIVPGGSTRQESVKNGLDALPKEARIALVHDGARPLISRELIARCIWQTEDCGSAVVCTPVTDTVKVEKDGCVVRTLDRSQLRAVQTPQCFFAGELKAAYEAAARDGVSVTDDASVMEHAGHSVHLLESSEVNFKLTTPEDLRRAEDIIGERKFMQRLPRTGFGYDVHKLASGRRLTPGEENYILTWLSWGFGEKEIGLAYEKTCLATGGLKWPYCNSILRSWHEQGFTTLSQIEAGDRAPVKPAAGKYSRGVQQHNDALSDLIAAIDRMLNEKED